MQQGYQNQPNPTYGQAQQSGGGVPDFDPDIPFDPIGLSCKRLLHCI